MIDNSYVSNTKQQLIAARDLISDPGRWITEKFAINKNGNAVMSTASDACAWCALGAIYRVSGYECNEAIGYLKKFAIKTIAIDNDNLGHAAVMKMYDKAIDSCP